MLYYGLLDRTGYRQGETKEPRARKRDEGKENVAQAYRRALLQAVEGLLA
jgi:hypothetical protein